MPRTALPLFAVLILATTSSAADPQYQDPELTAKERQHWSFVPPRRPAIPSTKSQPPTKNPIDAFVLAKLEANGIAPAPEADRLTLIRRVTFDLTGLPPTPAEVDAFLQDTAAGAYERLVDRLLASPHHGERWGQHWLDVVRFAESNGYELDAERPQAWRYRDYVIRSLNADKPYDRFVREQVAGDLLAAGQDPRDVPDLWHATGLHRCGQVHMVSGNLDKDEVRQEVLTEMVNGLGSAVLGLTVGCARCHDHKFDPLSQGDYFRLQAFFAGTRFKDVDLATEEEKDALKRKLLKVSIRLNPIKKQVADLEAPYRAKLLAEKKAKLDPKMREAVDADPKKRTDEQKKLAEAAKPLLKVAWDEVLEVLTPEDRATRAALKEKQHKIELELPQLPPQAWAVADEKSAPPTHVLKRGDVTRKLTAVGPAYPRVLTGETAVPRNRLDLAKWLTRPENPLTARVVVNRLWQHHFGRGIVATPNDFGTRGDRPTHPELLDWLARELVEPTVGDGRPWTLKRMHRLMVCSATYRQSSSAERGTRNAELKKVGASIPNSAIRTPHSIDPENALLWRMNRRRLEAEAIRDAVLAAAGTLNREVGGPSVKVPLEPEVYDLIFTEDEPSGLWPVTADPKQHVRRSIYLFLKRNVRLPMLEAFDQPDTLNSCAVRPVSTFAPQALILMNGPFTREQSRAMADDLARTLGTDPTAQVTALYRRALGRPPTDAEMRLCREFLTRQGNRALADLCLAVFNTNEFAHVP
jgi:hypothetical protein